MPTPPIVMKKPDAVVFPVSLMGEGDRFQRGERIRNMFAPVLGGTVWLSEVAELPGQMFGRVKPEGNPDPPSYFLDTTKAHRYRWDDQGNGISYGYLPEKTLEP